MSHFSCLFLSSFSKVYYWHTVYIRNIFFHVSSTFSSTFLRIRHWARVSNLCTSEMITLGLVADTFGFTRSESKTTQIWKRRQKLHNLTGRKLVMDRLHRIFHGEVHNISERMHTRSAGALVRDMSREEMLAKMNALEKRTEQSWISHQAILLDETNSVAGDALDIKRRNLFSERTQKKRSKAESRTSSSMLARRSTLFVRCHQWSS